MLMDVPDAEPTDGACYSNALPCAFYLQPNGPSSRTSPSPQSRIRGNSVRYCVYTTNLIPQHACTIVQSSVRTCEQGSNSCNFQVARSLRRSALEPWLRTDRGSCRSASCMPTAPPPQCFMRFEQPTCELRSRAAVTTLQDAGAGTGSAGEGALVVGAGPFSAGCAARPSAPGADGATWESSLAIRSAFLPVSLQSSASDV